jgi:hypothetical protein
MSSLSRTETQKPSFGMQAKLFKTLHPANCYLRVITVAISFSILQLVQVWCRAQTIRSSLHELTSSQSFHDFEQEQGRQFAVGPGGTREANARGAARQYHAAGVDAEKNSCGNIPQHGLGPRDECMQTILGDRPSHQRPHARVRHKARASAQSA